MNSFFYDLVIAVLYVASGMCACTSSQENGMQRI